MAITAIAKSNHLSFEDYMSEGEVNLRYDIMNGERIWMSAPSWNHQRIQLTISLIFARFENSNRKVRAIGAPFDLLINRRPLRTRQPDVMLISKTRLEAAGGPPAQGPLEIGPELVVEILSASDRVRALHDKLTDYRSIGVKECWIVRPQDKSIEVLSLSEHGVHSEGVNGEGESVASRVFPGLSAKVDDVFAD